MTVASLKIQSCWNKVYLYTNANGIPYYWDFANNSVNRSATVRGEHIPFNAVVLTHCLSHSADWKIICLSLEDSEPELSWDEAEADIECITDPADILVTLRIAANSKGEYREPFADEDAHPRPKALMLAIDNLPRILEAAEDDAEEIRILIQKLERTGRSIGVYLTLTEDATVSIY